MTHYTINPKHCKGCIYARCGSAGKAYENCAAYVETFGAVRPEADSAGRCINKKLKSRKEKQNEI